MNQAVSNHALYLRRAEVIVVCMYIYFKIAHYHAIRPRNVKDYIYQVHIISLWQPNTSAELHVVSTTLAQLCAWRRSTVNSRTLKSWVYYPLPQDVPCESVYFI